MDYPVLQDLQPHEFFYWFGEICKIPHGSRNEKLMVDFLTKFADDRGLAYTVDTMGNVFMNIPASVGYEDQPSILFQAHVDMVCVKDEGVDFSFETDPLRLKRTDDKLYAEGTSLGADNAVGVATMLAIADSSDIAHPPLEFLFTVEEEIGLNGIRAFDKNCIQSRRMINMDCGDSHVIAVSSMGKCAAEITRSFDLQPTNDTVCTLKVQVSSGIGGHSGLSIRKGRCCACNTMSELLLSLDDVPFRLSALNVSTPAIIKECTAVVTIAKDDVDRTIQTLQQTFEGIKSIYEKTDPDVSLAISSVPTPREVLSAEESRQIAELLSFIKTAPIREDGGDHTILITLSTLSDASLNSGTFTARFLLRSSNGADLKLLSASYERMAGHLGFVVTYTDYYDGWLERAVSPFRNKFVAVHEQLFHTTPSLERVQGGIETSIITAAIPDMDAVGIAPTARGAHTTTEHIILSEVPDYWQLLLSVLEKKE